MTSKKPAINLEGLCESIASHVGVELEEMSWDNFFKHYLQHTDQKTHKKNPNFVFEIEKWAWVRLHGRREGDIESEYCLSGECDGAQVCYARLDDVQGSSECVYVETPVIKIKIMTGMNQEGDFLCVTDRSIPDALNVLTGYDARHPHQYRISLGQIMHKHGDAAGAMMLTTLLHILNE